MHHYSLINKLTAKPGKRDEAISILLESGKPFLQNKACILYLVYQDTVDQNLIWVVDLWTSQQEHDAATANQALRPFVAQVAPLLEDAPEQIKVALMGGKGL